MVDSIATSPAIDLSALPPPQLIDQPDFEVRFASKLARFIYLMEQTVPGYSALVESDPGYKLFESDSYDETVLVQQFIDGMLQHLVAFATGANLEGLAVFYGLTRLELSPANPGTGATAIMESDSDLRERMLLAPHSFSVAGPERAYISFARNAASDVLDASATSPKPDDIKLIVLNVLQAHAAPPALVAAMTTALDEATWPCEVVVSVLSRTFPGIAPPATLAAVTAALNDDVRPMTDLVTVQSVELVEFNIVANLYRYAGPDAALLMNSATASLNKFLIKNKRIGRDIPRSALISALHVGGIQRVELTSPAADVVISKLQAGYALNIVVADAGIAD